MPETPAGLRYEICGSDMQYVEFQLDQNETVVSEAGALLYLSDRVQMQTVFGDPRANMASLGGAFSALLAAGKRLVVGESLFLTCFVNPGPGAARAAFAAPYPGKIVPLDISALGTVLCQKYSYLCSSIDVEVDIAFTKRIGSGLFGGEGFILQRLAGGGTAFVHAGGTINRLQLAAGESLKVDTGSIVAFQQSVDYDIQYVGDIKSAIFGGEGLFFARLTGPGTVFLQSLPFSRLADRIYRAMPRRGGRQVGEGGILNQLLRKSR